MLKNELFRLLQHEDLKHTVVLVFANKQDLKDAMPPAEITEALSLHSIKNRDWHIQACCALTGEGLYDGLGWIVERVAIKPTNNLKCTLHAKTICLFCLFGERKCSIPICTYAGS